MPNLAVDVDSWARSACYPRSTFYPLSDGPPTRGRRITRACFRTCSACGPRSQARLYSCIQKDGCRPSRADLRAPPLPFRRRPPQSNCPPGTVPEPVDGLGLGRRSREGSIPRAAPRGLAPPDRCLLPILYTRDQRPMPSCSEGSRGLSVLPRVSRIFTTSAISPGPWSRQRPSRCAFRAGRNLPDKEFRYLRTVIVTAAVYRGFNSGLHPQGADSSSQPSGTGQVSGCIHHLSSLHSPVFLLNSCLGLFSAPHVAVRTPYPEVTGSVCLVP